MEGQALRWTQPNPFARVYHLQDGEQILSSLQWQKPWGSLALASSPAGEWTFRRDGLWRARIEIHAAGSGADVGIFRQGFGGSGTLEMADGRLFHFAASNAWHREWDWLDADHERLMRFRARQGLRTAESQLTIEPAGRDHPDLPLLSALGWYLLLLHAAGGVAAASG